MDNIREKLVELLNEADDQCAKMACSNCGYVKNPVHCKSFRFADHLIANGVTVQEWRPASDPPKEDYKDVLVYFEYFRYGEYNRLFRTIGISYVWNGEWSNFVNGQSGWRQLKILAWMPLPEEPKGE